jgi:hypothetical protein
MKNTAKPVVEKPLFERVFDAMQKYYHHGDPLENEMGKANAVIEICRKEFVSDTREGIEADLKEISHYFGGWSELRKVIDELEQNDNEAAYDRAYSRD